MISDTPPDTPELSPLDIAELARIVLDHRTTTHRIMESSRDTPSPEQRKEILAEAALTLQQRLSKWADIPLWIRKYITQRGEWITVFLNEGEKNCSEKRVRAPRRTGAGYILDSDHKPETEARFERITLRALLDNQTRIDRLYGRLDQDCVAPYSPEDLVQLDLNKTQTIWTWDNGEIYPTTLLCSPMADVDNGPTGEYPVCIPAAWGPLYRWSYGHGALHLHEGFTLVVCNALGRYGLIQLRQLEGTAPRVVGQWIQSCSWAYLSGGNRCGSGILEAASSVVPDVRGELVCDLIDARDGHQINPPGVKALMGSTNYEGTIVVNEAGVGHCQRVLGRVSRQGILYHGRAAQSEERSNITWRVDDLHWLEIGSQREGLTAVRSAENGLWGYVDKGGAICITPQFGDVRAFDYGTAAVQPKGSNFWGLINTSGQWNLQPEWAYLKRWSKRIIVAEDAKLRWGAINAQGKIIVEFHSVEEWMDHPEVAKRMELNETNGSWRDNAADIRLTLIEAIAEMYKLEFHRKARRALLDCSTSLAGLEGIFDADTTERDLMEAGVWGKEVRLLRGKTHGLLQPAQGESGQIRCYYPVGLSTFDLSIEAPVNGLDIQPEATIGIPWRDLELIREPSDKPKKTRNTVQKWISTVWDMFTHLLGFMLLYVRMGFPGICLHVILSGVYKHSLVPTIPGLLCLAYIVFVTAKVAVDIARNHSLRVQEIQALALADSRRFFWSNLVAFFAWAILVMIFKGNTANWFASLWALAAIGGVLWMSRRIM
nr:WG repeat-containing protein [uncultured Desulfobulbus sp.]